MLNLLVLDFDQTIISPHTFQALQKEEVRIRQEIAKSKMTFNSAAEQEQYIQDKIAAYMSKQLEQKLFNINHPQLLRALIQNALDNDDDVAIASFTKYPAAVLAALKFMGLPEEYISKIKLACYLPEAADQKAYGKNKHILGLMQDTEYDKVILVDDDVNNITTFEQAGLGTVILAENAATDSSYLVDAAGNLEVNLELSSKTAAAASVAEPAKQTIKDDDDMKLLELLYPTVDKSKPNWLRNDDNSISLAIPRTEQSDIKKLGVLLSHIQACIPDNESKVMLNKISSGGTVIKISSAVITECAQAYKQMVKASDKLRQLPGGSKYAWATKANADGTVCISLQTPCKGEDIKELEAFFKQVQKALGENDAEATLVTSSRDKDAKVIRISIKGTNMLAEFEPEEKLKKGAPSVPTNASSSKNNRF